MQAGCDAMTCGYIAQSKPCGNSSSINLPCKKLIGTEGYRPLARSSSGTMQVVFQAHKEREFEVDLPILLLVRIIVAF